MTLNNRIKDNIRKVMPNWFFSKVKDDIQVVVNEDKSKQEILTEFSNNIDNSIVNTREINSPLYEDVIYKVFNENGKEISETQESLLKKEETREEISETSKETNKEIPTKKENEEIDDVDDAKQIVASVIDEYNEAVIKTNHIQEYLVNNEKSQQVVNAKELFSSKPENIKFKTELNAKEIFIFSYMVSADRILKDKNMPTIYNDFIQDYMSMKVSFERKSRNEFVTISTGGNDSVMNKLNNMHSSIQNQTSDMSNVNKPKGLFSR